MRKLPGRGKQGMFERMIVSAASLGNASKVEPSDCVIVVVF